MAENKGSKSRGTKAMKQQGREEEVREIASKGGQARGQSRNKNK